MLSCEMQIDLLSHLMHQCLADRRHKTNVHAHHQIPYDGADAKSRLSSSLQTQFNSSKVPSNSFFLMSPDSTDSFLPINPKTHSSFTVSQFLHRKLRWLTLGKQYDWTRKSYPNQDDPPFPQNIKNIMQSIFPKMVPEAAIVNIYSPGDTLSVHRDVSEESDEGLVSISLGCDGLFVAANEFRGNDQPKCVVIRLRSGDAVYMSGPARFAWHGVPQIIPNTCPDWLGNWPADARDKAASDDLFEKWQGWMSNKRINLNIRQVYNYSVII